jgi:hypothetical protein
LLAKFTATRAPAFLQCFVPQPERNPKSKTTMATQNKLLLCFLQNQLVFPLCIHNHNNNQTKPKKQPNTKNKPNKNPQKKCAHKKTHNNNQTKTINSKTGCSFSENSTSFSSIRQQTFLDSHQFGTKKIIGFIRCVVLFCLCPT